MRRNGFTCLLSLALVLLLGSGPVLAEKKEKRQPRRGRAAQIQFFSPAIASSVPGINALVTLSPEQKKKLAAVRKEGLGSDEIKKAMATMRDKNASKEDKAAARKVVAQNRTALAEKTKGILTAEQKELVAKIDGAYKEVQQEVRQGLREKGKAARGDKEARAKMAKEAREKSVALFKARLDGILTAEQKQILARAAKAPKGKAAREGKEKTKERKKKREKKSGADV